MKGFTLLEVVIALAIMTGVILTVITSFNYHLSIAGRDREETVSLLLAREKLEEIELRSKKEIQTFQDGTFAPEHPEISWKAEISPTEVDLFKKLTLTVMWGNGKRTLSLVHYIAQ
ncbi:MAG TPA: type II secretion system minor pseudopilin GspI [Geobacteraceae bacterium]|nr:type II secretion system minor pseudopilin GspI [Geobacteraceae bacterium]